MIEFKLPKLEGNKPVGPDIIYFSCDPKYWHEYGFYLAKSTIHFNPDIFLPLIDINLVNNITKKILNDEFILENIMASNSINVKNKYNRILFFNFYLIN